MRKYVFYITNCTKFIVIDGPEECCTSYRSDDYDCQKHSNNIGTLKREISISYFRF